MDKSIENLRRWAVDHITWFGQSAFRIRAASGQSAFIDPYRVRAAEGPADLIMVTHPHADHHDRKAIEGLRREGTIIVLPRSCAEQGHVPIAAGESHAIGPFRITGIAAYNVKKKFHPRSGNWLGYIVEVEGVRVYHAGDTDLIPEMRDLRPDIALLPVGGMVTMKGRTAAEATGVLKAPLSIPMHFGFFLGGRGAGDRFVRFLGEGGLVLPRAEPRG